MDNAPIAWEIGKIKPEYFEVMVSHIYQPAFAKLR
jgi:hypothetical protein